MTTPANPLIAERVDTTTWYSGFGLVESLDMLIDGVRSQSWVDGTLGVVGTGAEVAVWVFDPIGALVAAGFGMFVEHVKPLSDALDWLAGDPDQVSANAATWHNVSVAQADAAAQYLAAVSTDLPGWSGQAADAYRTQAAETTELVQSLSKAGEAMATIVAATGSVVSMVRTLVRDLIGELVSILLVRIPMWLAETAASFGLATPWVAAQVSSLVARWGAKIARLLRGLTASLRNIMPVVRQLDGTVDTIATLLRRRPRLHVTDNPAGSLDVGAGGGWRVIDETPGGAVAQLTDHSCVPAAGEMLSGRPQLELIDRLPPTSNAQLLAEELGDGWQGGFVGHYGYEEALDALNAKAPWGAEFKEVDNRIAHMVVVDGFNPDGLVRIRDPWDGGSTYLMTVDEFLRVWNGNAVFKP